MFISPTTAIENNWITHPRCETLDDWKQLNFISPNAIDFTLDHVNKIDGQTECFISEHYGKTMREQQSVNFVQSKKIPTWELAVGCYDGTSDMYVEIPSGVAAYVITRSTFNRNGLFIQSGLYDAGFKGNIGIVLYNIAGTINVTPHTRIGQIIFVKSDSIGHYAGQYNTEPGQHWTRNFQ